MTAQIGDSILLNSNEFAIAGVNGDGLFSPQDHGLNPVVISTACWRGFFCTYDVHGDMLRLKDLYIGLDEDQTLLAEQRVGPILDGKLPRFVKREYCHKYTAVNHAIPFTGGLLAASGFIRGLYVHMGFHPAWKYQHVIELVFREGSLVDSRNVSDRMQLIRERVSQRDLRPDSTNADEVSAWIDDCFSLSYD